MSPALALRSARAPRFRIPALAALAFGLALPAAGHAQCPTSRIVLRNDPLPPIAGAVYDTVMTDGRWGADFDLTQGRVHTFQGGTLAETSVEGVDAYDVTGVPAGTPVTLTAVFSVDGTISGPCSGSGCAGQIEFTLTHGVEVSTISYQQQVRSGVWSVHDERTLAVTFVAGTPEVLAFKLFGHHLPGGGNPTEATGTLRFLGMPPGVNVTSCHGYSLEATPARRTSWGRLKTRYR